MGHERPVTKTLLASFIEYALEGKVTLLEWNRFIIEHYADVEMENARIACARILRKGSSNVTDVDKSEFLEIVDRLRS